MTRRPDDSAPRIISLGSINADFAVRAEEVPSGPGAILAHDLLRTSGGKAANVAVLARRLGAPASLLACVGDDDLADQALAGPRAEDVDLTGVRRRPGPTAYSSITVPRDGAKSIVLALNANDEWADDADAVRDDVRGAPAGSVVVVDLEVPELLARAALEAAREQNLTTVLDPAPPQRLDEELLALADHVIPDHQEAEQLTDVDTESIEGAERAAAQLRERGARTAHVKLADGGCVTASPEGVWIVEAPDDVEVVDATGAGDAFAGGLSWALLMGEPVERAAAIAVAAATCAVTAYGSQESYPSLAALRSMAERVVATSRGS
ncbi:MAG TPA: PfkB family carbohydrate kinase [Acidimicrobiales bacterium]